MTVYSGFGIEDEWERTATPASNCLSETPTLPGVVYTYDYATGQTTTDLTTRVGDHLREQEAQALIKGKNAGEPEPHMW